MFQCTTRSSSTTITSLQPICEMHTTAPSNPVHSPYTPTISLLQSALTLPNQHPWLADYLFTNDPLQISDLVSGLQNASAALIDLLCLPTSPDSPIQERLALIPVFSKGPFTIGVQVRLSVQSLPSSASSPSIHVVSVARFVFDNHNVTLLTVDSASSLAQQPTPTIALSLQTISPLTGRTHTTLRLHGKAFRDLSAKRKICAPLLLNALMACEHFEETRNSCLLCNKGTSELCECRFDTGLPMHPMDFSRFAPNFVLFQGSFAARRVAWRRGGDGALVRIGGKSGRCEMGVCVDEAGVGALCRLAGNSANISREEESEIVDGVSRVLRERRILLERRNFRDDGSWEGKELTATDGNFVFESDSGMDVEDIAFYECLSGISSQLRRTREGLEVLKRGNDALKVTNEQLWEAVSESGWFE